METERTRSRIRPLWLSPTMRQVYTSIAALIPILSTGCRIGYTSILYPQLETPDSIIPLNASNISWIASMSVLPIMFICMSSGYCQQRYGRKKTQYAMCFFYTVGWITIALSNNVETLISGRFLTGIGTGFGATVTSVFIAETTSPHTRHIYLSGIAAIMTCGMLLVHLLGTYLHWKTVAWICASFPILSSMMIFHLLDTPNWYISRGNISDGERAFKWYRGSSEEGQNEFENMMRSANNSKSVSNLSEVFSNLKKREFWKPLLILGCFFALLQASGDYVMASYSITIMKDILGDKFDPYVLMLIVDTIRLGTMLFSSLILMKYLKRRTATLVSGILVFISLSGMATFMYLGKNHYVPENYSGVALVFLILHTISVPIGLSFLPWILLGEVFPANLKGIGTGICIFISTFVIFIVTKTAPHLFESIGVSLTFALYAIVVLILTIILAITLPETKGKTLQEIEDYFRGRDIDEKSRYERQLMLN